jgi:hypothetical protein
VRGGGGGVWEVGAVYFLPTVYNNNTPDLRNRFVLGAQVDRNLDGRDRAAVNIETNSIGQYLNTYTGGTKDAVVVSHSHGITDPGHRHQMEDGVVSFAGSGNWWGLSGGNGKPSPNTNIKTTGITINTEGVSGINQNLPPYYALAFIMRVS